MADVRFLQQRASACREAARNAGDVRESEELLHLARIYDKQVQQAVSRHRPVMQVQG